MDIPNFALKLRNAIIRCSAEGNPYLREHRVFRGAKEGLDPQILLDPFEELLNLPSLFIECSYFSSFQVMRVRACLRSFSSNICYNESLVPEPR